MTLQALSAELSSQAQAGQIQILAALAAAGWTVSPSLQTLVQGQLLVTGDLTLTAPTLPTPPAGQIIVTGTGSVLNGTGFGITVTFVGDAAQPDNLPAITVAMTPPAGWTLATSFPYLAGSGAVAVTPASTVLVLAAQSQSTYAWTDGGGTSHNTALAAGLNLIADVVPSGALAILDQILSGGEATLHIPLTGTVTIPPASTQPLIPALSLTGPIGPSLSANSSYFSFGQPSILVNPIPGDTSGMPYLFLDAPLMANGQTFMNVTAAVIGSLQLRFGAWPTNGGLTLADITTLAGGQNVCAEMPPFLASIFKEVGLLDFQIAFALPSMSVLSVGVGVGTATPWTLGPVTVDSLRLGFVFSNPFTANSQTSTVFTATLNFYPALFTGGFDLEVAQDDSGNWSVGATYSGSVSLNSLISTISDNAVTVPEDVAAITFEDFGVYLNDNGTSWDWTLFGTCQASFTLPIASGQAEASLQALVRFDGETHSYELQGGLTIGSSRFEATIHVAPSSTLLSASWTAMAGEVLDLNTLAEAIGLTSINLPPGLDLSLSSVTVAYDVVGKAFAAYCVSGASAGGDLLLVYRNTGTATDYGVLVNVGVTLDLSNLPLVGADLAAIGSLSLSGLSFVTASAALASEAEVLNGLVQALGLSAPSFPALPEGSLSATILSAILNSGTGTTPLLIALDGKSTTAAVGQAVIAVTTDLATATAPVTEGTAPATTSSPIYWLPIQRAFGPVAINRLGILYQSSQQDLWFELDATLTAGPLTLDLQGLGISTPLSSFDPQFALQGVGVAYSRPPLTLAGTLINLAPPGADNVELEGGIVVSTKGFTLEAFGYYGNASGVPSLFVFGDLARSIGGPPAFFVTGAALGFGYNSALRLPTIDEVQDFPFVQVLPTSNASKASLFGPDPTPIGVLDVIMGSRSPWVSAAPGALWLGAGITFTSFKLVNTQAMLFVESSDRLVVSLIGSAHAQFPQPKPEGGDGRLYASVELDFNVRFAPTEGVFSAEAVLARSSYLLDPACVLTGGFAFFVWYGDNPHAGDFVLTLGGYNPGFSPPDHYPTVPRVGFSWTMDSSITISGETYFALTPASLMAGSRLSATFQSGSLQAWFNAHTDVVARWKPFWFEADIGVVVGASYTIDLLFTSSTMSVELGCDLQFWGPPTGGLVTVDWTVISFSIAFGTARRSAPVATGWHDVEAMLPDTSRGAAPNVLSVMPTAGVASLDTGGSTAVSASGNTPWLARAGDFAFTVGTPIPVTTATIGSRQLGGDSFAVFPLNWSSVSSELTVALTDGNGNDVSGAFHVSGVRGAVPSSLWGPPPPGGGAPPVPAGDSLLVPDQLVGMAVSVLGPQSGATTGPVSLDVALAVIDLGLTGAQLPLSGSAPPQGGAAVNGGKTISLIVKQSSGIGSATARSARTAILSGLSRLGYAPTTPNASMAVFAATSGGLFTAEPLLEA